ncbi:MAG: polysaccharide deacetylase family protein, partial [Verrucomicrobiales bacterium]|nr:polysaccharide deacetylase family protein [Verrucomicrobiales bacterium]
GTVPCLVCLFLIFAMKIQRLLPLILLTAFSLSSCDKVDPFVEKAKRVLGRDKAPKQVVGLPEEEKLSNVPPPPEPVKMEPVINKKAKVSILGYHDFTESRRPTQMIINIRDFRDQMQAIKDAELPVISMRQFLDWKQAKKDIPPQSIMITIDDGWKDTHTLAMPILQEFGFPFTAFLYQKYVGVGGRSMTHEEIRDLIEAGGTICSHSVSHRNMAKPPGRSTEEKVAWLKAELEDSHNFLLQHFSEGVIKTFAYPYGIYNDQVTQMAKDFGYEACFTVSPGKAGWETEDMAINRYVIHGNSSGNFDAAISFGGGEASSAGRKLLSEQRDKETGEVKGPLIEVYPPGGSTVKNRLPRIEVNLSNLENIQADSVSMRISGLGKVPHHFDKEKQILSYQIPQRIRLDSCGINVSFRHSGNRDLEKIGWSFVIDKKSEYLSPATTLLRDADQPVDPEEDLVLAQKEDEEDPLPTKNAESGEVSTSENLLDPGNTIN